MKELVGLDPAAWLMQLGVQPSGPVTVVPTDLAGTTLVQSDQVLRVGGRRPWLVQIEFQSGRDARLVPRMHLYSTLLDRRHRLPVQSVLVLLRPQADARSLTGLYERRIPGGDIYLTFRYQVVRAWQQPVEQLLTGPLSTLPLAALVGLSVSEMSAVLQRIEDRVREEAAPSMAEQVRASTYLLLGLRFPEDVIEDLLRGVGTMAGALKESSTYQKILREGRAEGLAGAREALLRIGTRRFGPPDDATRDGINRLTDPQRFAQLIERVLDVSNWDELGLDKSTP